MPTFTIPDLPPKAKKFPPLEYMACFEFRKVKVEDDGTTKLESAVRLSIVENMLTRQNCVYTVSPAKIGNWRTYVYPDADSLRAALKPWTERIASRGYFLVTDTPIMVPMTASDMRAVRDKYMPRWAPDWASKILDAAELAFASSGGVTTLTATDASGAPVAAAGATLPTGISAADLIKGWADDDEDEVRESETSEDDA